MDSIFIYRFEDGTKISIINKRFSAYAISRMEEFHGKVTKIIKKSKIQLRKTSILWRFL